MAAKSSRPRFTSAFGACVRLSAEQFAEDSSKPLRWAQVCLEGTYLGHPRFPKIDWTPEVFETIVKNFRAHPSYVAGPDGYGSARVRPWDYEHANEVAASKGAIPPEGLPAASWVYDLEVRKDESGKASLWSLNEWLPRAAAQITAAEIQFCSVCVLPKYIDPVSGVDQGPTLTSIAFTNDPFVQGMMPLAATLEQWGPAESALEVLVGVRSALELPEEATAQQAIQQLRALLEAIANDTIPEYVEEGFILDRIRRLLKLPLLATPEEILGGAEQALNQLSTGGVTPVQPAEEQPMAATLAALTAITAIFGCANDDQAIIQAAQAAKSKADTAEANTEITDAISKLKGLFGSSDMGDLLAKATKAIADAETLKPTVAALNEALAALKSGAESDAKNEADAVAASMAAAAGNSALKDRLYPAILQVRVSCIDEKTGKVDEAKLQKFRTDYPLPEEQRALLTRTIVAGQNGVQLGGPATGLGTAPIMQTGAPLQGANDPEAEKIAQAINAQPGRNPIEKTNAYLLSARAAHKSLSLPEQIRIAGEFSRQLLTGKVPQGI